MYIFETNKISKEEFLNLNEDNLLFITNPGRMGDEDGITFIMKDNNELTIYRVDGWLYPKEENPITLDDAFKQFPKWREAWNNGEKENYNGKYRFIYMGFGNGLCVDNSIYNEFKPYLDEAVEVFLSKEHPDERESLKYVAVFRSWDDAFVKMTNDKGYVLKKK